MTKNGLQVISQFFHNYIFCISLFMRSNGKVVVVHNAVPVPVVVVVVVVVVGGGGGGGGGGGSGIVVANADVATVHTTFLKPVYQFNTVIKYTR